MAEKNSDFGHRVGTTKRRGFDVDFEAFQKVLKHRGFEVDDAIFPKRSIKSLKLQGVDRGSVSRMSWGQPINLQNPVSRAV